MLVAKLVTLLLALLVAALASGCGAAAEPATAPPTTTSSTPPAQAYTVEELAAKLGCAAELQGKAADFRQASCTVDGANFVLLDFQTADGQRAWLDYATMFGGVYLAGERWALSGKSKEYLEELRTTLGGTIEEDTSQG
ncbi:MAG: hypothetical protein GEV28_32750 [Actinophytocola sp.]|uniref:hypothetical protein n=1 Tax=Actinophytocola sp. TaxID=1872138 RepID=UPI001324D3FB|nr:hypothetical protein [Actinophytocola sp.]MPZ84898.1 hypothetical protein [Actinophytocola sp.]